MHCPKIMPALLAVGLFGLLTVSAPSIAEPLPSGFSIVTASQLEWNAIPDGLGAQAAIVQGDPSREGMYVVRVRFPAHVMDMPHVHSQDRYVTVLEGDWYVGTGPEFDPAKATRLAAGSHMFHPANGVHWDGSAGDKPTVVQIIGMGPVTNTPLNEDGPDWVIVK